MVIAGHIDTAVDWVLIWRPMGFLGLLHASTRQIHSLQRPWWLDLLATSLLRESQSAAVLGQSPIPVAAPSGAAVVGVSLVLLPLQSWVPLGCPALASLASFKVFVLT